MLAKAWTPARAGTSACWLAAVTIPRVPAVAGVPALLVSYRGIFITYIQVHVYNVNYV